MQEAFTVHYVNDAVRQFRNLKELAEKALAQIRDDDFFTALDEEDNSIAVVLKHLAGSMRTRWTDFPTRAEGNSDRDRDSEFIINEGDSRKALMERSEAGWQCLFEALESLTAEDIVKTVLIRGQSLSVIEAINRQLTHYAYHVGQIVFLAKHFQSDRWQSLSIPRGQSTEFDAEARKRREL
jgi:Protein of unknown function (DUF1572)